MNDRDPMAKELAMRPPVEPAFGPSTRLVYCVFYLQLNIRWLRIGENRDTPSLHAPTACGFAVTTFGLLYCRHSDS